MTYKVLLSRNVILFIKTVCIVDFIWWAYVSKAWRKCTSRAVNWCWYLWCLWQSLTLQYRFHQDVSIDCIVKQMPRKMNYDWLSVTLYIKTCTLNTEKGIQCPTQDRIYFVFPKFLSLWSLVLQTQDSLREQYKHLDAKLNFKIKRFFFTKLRQCDSYNNRKYK